MAEMGVDEKLIMLPDFNDENQNAQREELLRKVRGWKSHLLFHNFPQDTTWYEVEVTPEDIRQFRFINHSYWTKLSQDTRLVKDAAGSVKAGEEVFGESNDRFLDSAKRIEQGEIPPEIIGVADSQSGPFTILEGHLRATAYALAQESPKIVNVILGISPGIKVWNENNFG